MSHHHATASERLASAHPHQVIGLNGLPDLNLHLDALGMLDLLTLTEQQLHAVRSEADGFHSLSRLFTEGELVNDGSPLSGAVAALGAAMIVIDGRVNAAAQMVSEVRRIWTESAARRAARDSSPG